MGRSVGSMSADRLRLRDRILPSRRTTLIDFRGHRYNLVRKEDLSADAPCELTSLVREANEHTLGSTLRMAIGFVLGLLAYCIWYGAMPKSVIELLLALFGLVVCVAWGITWNSLFARRCGIKAVRACADTNICPSCGYTLNSLPIESDGCVICSECGGAWKALFEKTPPPP